MPRSDSAGMTSAACVHRRATQPSATEGEVAERNRRGKDADDRVDDEAFDDAADADEEEERVSRGGTATRARAREVSPESRRMAKKETERVGVGIFGRFMRFLREVVAELRKVIWPTRKELLTYTAVVVVFLTVVTAIVAGLDFVFAKAVLWVFGKAG
jgi:preprotein translocase subunit SecE